MMPTRELSRDSAFRSAFVLAMLGAILSVAVLGYAAALTDKGLSAATAALFALTIALAAIMLVQRILKLSTHDEIHMSARLALRMMSAMSAIVYGWAAAAMFVVYLISGPAWRHGWQYGSLFALIAFGLTSYVRNLQQSDHPASAKTALTASVLIAAIHAVAALAVAVWIFFSGKLDTIKGDWAANHIFLAGAIALAILGGLTVATQNVLKNRAVPS